MIQKRKWKNIWKQKTLEQEYLKKKKKKKKERIKTIL